MSALMNARRQGEATGGPAETAELHSFPRAPRNIEETGLNTLFLVELASKILYNGGQLRLTELATRIKLPFGVLEPLVGFMRAERLCEVVRRGEAETDVTYTLTELGRVRAEDYLQKSRYAGPAPVTLQDYVAQVQKQSIAGMRVTHEQMDSVFSKVVANPRVLGQFGAAMNSGRAMFLYGPAGSGKTFLAERLAKVLSGRVYVPYAIAIDADVIQVFDPQVHRRVDIEVIPGSIIESRKNRDERWQLCERPVVVAGGELTLAMLDIEFDEHARYYHMPPQVKANNGLLVIDDLGRQLVPPHQLMNRWIVPLDRKVDYLSLHSGAKFTVPFDVKVIFSTNLTPQVLDDDAFLRRLGYKIFLGPLDELEYRQVFRGVCEELGIAYADRWVEYLLRRHQYHGDRPLLACIPRDILEQVRDRTAYSGAQLELSEEMLDWAWGNYFAGGWNAGETQVPVGATFEGA